MFAFGALAGDNGVQQVFVAGVANFEFRAERLFGVDSLCAFIDEGAGIGVIGAAVPVPFHEVLLDHGADLFHEIPHVAQQRVDAQDGQAGLDDVVDRHSEQSGEDDDGYEPPQRVENCQCDAAEEQQRDSGDRENGKHGYNVTARW